MYNQKDYEKPFAFLYYFFLFDQSSVIPCTAYVYCEEDYLTLISLFFVFFFSIQIGLERYDYVIIVILKCHRMY